MSQQYQRFFVALNKDSDGYDYKGRTPMGRCILESRGGSGKLSLWAQDLKPEVMYKICLLFEDNGKFVGVPVGSLVVDGKGKGEIRCEFDAYNVGGYRLEDFYGVLTLVQAKTGYEPPLCGFKGAPTAWKEKFYIQKQEPDKKNPLQQAGSEYIPEEKTSCEPELVYDSEPELIRSEECTIELEVEPVPPCESEPVRDLDPEPELEQEPTRSEPGVAEPELKWEEEEEIEPSLTWSDESQQDETNEEFYLRFRNMADTLTKELDELKQIAAVPKQPATQLDELFIACPQVQPFKRQNRNVEWIQISINDIEKLPGTYHHLISAAFVHTAYHRYSHLIAGRVRDSAGAHCIVGIPGSYEPLYKPIVIKLGFNQFKCCEDVRPSYGEHGYWLMSAAL